jgi:hypothetical protein
MTASGAAKGTSSQDADHEVAEHVAADCVRDVGGHGARARLAVLRHSAVGELEDLRPVHQEQEGDHEDREELHEAAEHSHGDVAKRSRRIAELARKLCGLLLELRDDVVFLVVVAEGLVLLQVVDVAGRVVGEVVDAVDDRRDYDEPDPEDARRDAEIHEQDRHRPRHLAIVEPVDRGGDRQREEDRDQHQAHDLANQVEEIEGRQHRAGDEDDLRDQAG